MPRPRKHLPRGARSLLMAQAESGALSETKAAKVLGLSHGVFKRLLRDDADARETWEEACAVERDLVRSSLSEKAREGDTNAARTFLALFHGMREQGSTGDDSRSNISIHLPGTMTEQQYRRLFEHQPAGIEHDGG